MANVILLLVFFATLSSAALMIAARLFKTAVSDIVEAFRSHGALTEKTSKTADELRLLPQGFQFRILRDYRPQALQFLIDRQVIVVTGDNRLYLSEAGLDRFMRFLEGRRA